ncbi:hypothetical protein [Streptomyces sp. NPDC057460]|uniref:hypothetical protein n=1 Tax=Streptomyces sp. NPDC057460 TaxID=3346141 RepID=UPI00367E40C8
MREPGRSLSNCEPADEVLHDCGCRIVTSSQVDELATCMCRFGLPHVDVETEARTLWVFECAVLDGEGLGDQVLAVLMLFPR